MQSESRRESNLELMNENIDAKTSLKPVPKDLIKKFIKEMCQDICNKNKMQHQYITLSDNTNMISIFTNDFKQGEVFLEETSKYIAFKFGEFIEKETGENRKKYYRSLTMFESSIEGNRVSITWS